MAIKISSNEKRSTLHREWGNCLNDWVGKAGWSQTILADKAGLSVGTIKKMLKGEMASDNSLAYLLGGLYREKTGLELLPADILDWMALAGFTVEGVLTLLQDERPLSVELWQEVQAWLQKGCQTGPRAAPSLPSAYIKRKELLTALETGLTELSGYRQPSHRVIVLHGLPGSGKTTLAQGILQHEQVQAFFRSGILWLRYAHDTEGDTQRRFQRWQKWLTDDTTAGLIVVDDAVDPNCLDQLVRTMGRQIVLLFLHQDRDWGDAVFSGQLKASEILRIRVGGLTLDEGIRLTGQVSGDEPLSGEDIVAREKLIRNINSPTLLRLLAVEAGQRGWGAVEEMLWRSASGEFPSSFHPRVIFERSWQRVNADERHKMYALMDAIRREGSFGAGFAALCWNMTEAAGLEWLRHFNRRGWLERVTESQHPPTLVHAFGAERFRFPPQAAQFIRRQREPKKSPRFSFLATWRVRWQRFARFGKSFRESGHITRRYTAVLGTFLMWGLFIWGFVTIFLPFFRNKEWEMRWHNTWSRGMQSRRLLQIWRERGAYPPEEIWLLHDVLQRDLRVINAILSLALLASYIFYKLPAGHNLTGWGIMLAVWIPFTWLYFTVTVWLAVLLWRYGYPETIEMRGVRRLFTKIGWQRALPVRETEGGVAAKQV